MTLKVKSEEGDMQVAYASIDEIVFKAGRRHHIEYRDLGVEAATRGGMRAEVLHFGASGVRMATGWHYHECDVQFLYVLEGTGQIEFLDGRVIQMKEGDSLMIPGGIIHQELGSGEAGRALEITIPAKINTVNVEIPAKSTVAA